MKFSTTVISVSLLAASSTTTTDAFAPRINRPSVLPRTANYVTMVDEIETTAQIELTSAAAIKSLTYRDLQTHCKNRGLQAVGTTAVLRERLMEDTGLCRTKPMSDECDVEVRRCVFIRLRYKMKDRRKAERNSLRPMDTFHLSIPYEKIANAQRMLK